MRRETLPPLREDYFELDRHVHFVDVPREQREAFVELLEAHGFQADFDSRGEVIRTFLPFYVDTKKKTYRTAGNVTCAAAAASHRMILDLDEFQIIYDRDIKEQK